MRHTCDIYHIMISKVKLVRVGPSSVYFIIGRVRILQQFGTWVQTNLISNKVLANISSFTFRGYCPKIFQNK